MATSAGEIEVKLTLKQGDFQKMLGQSQKEVQSFGDKTASFIKDHALVITGALTTIAIFAKKAIDAYAEQEAATNKLAQAMANQGVFSQQAIDHLTDMAAALQETTGATDESIISAQALMTTFGLQGAALDRATKATIDMSSAMGIDLNQAAQLVGKAFVGETGALSRYGIVVAEGTEKSKKFEAVLAQVEKRFGGTAQAQMQTFSGQVKSMSNAFGELMEAIGKVLVGGGKTGGITGFITDAIKAMTWFVEALGTAKGALVSFASVVALYFLTLWTTISNTILTVVQKLYELAGQLPLIGALYQAIGEKVGALNTALQTNLSRLMAGRLMAIEGARKIAEAETAKTQVIKNAAAEEFDVRKAMSDFINKQQEVDHEKFQAKLKDEHDLFLEWSESFLATNKEMWEFAGHLSDFFFDGVGDAFAEMIVDGKSFGAAMKQIFRDMAKQIISYIVTMIAKLIAFLILREAARQLGGAYGQAASAAMTAAANATTWGGAGMAEGGMINEPSIMTGLRSGRSHLVGEAGPEAVVPMNKSVSEMGGGGGITINIVGQFVEGDEAKWQRLIREKVVPEIRRFTMSSPTGPFNRKRGVI
jgi:hypothetical protein